MRNYSYDEYTYDNVGNRISKTAVEGDVSVVTSYTYNEENRLTQSVTGDVTTYYGYDNNGNQISEWIRIANVPVSSDSNIRLEFQKIDNDDLLTFYEYDIFNRLSKIKQGKDVIETVYTADGKKLSRTTNGNITYYIYDGNVVIEELNEDNEETARNVYGRNRITREDSSNKIVYGYNGHGDVIYQAKLDGEVLLIYGYDEFGNVVFERNLEDDGSLFAPSMVPPIGGVEELPEIEYHSIDNPYRYAGYEYLEQIGIYDLNARYYNPEIARFLSPDPYYNLGNRVIGLYEINVPNAWKIVFSNALYTYCGNNPIGFNDYSGLDPVPQWASRIKYGGATEEDYEKALRIHSIGTASAWAGSAGFIVRYAIKMALERENKITTLDYNGLNLIANRERNLNTIKYDETKKIVSIPKYYDDVGYGFDISQENLPAGFVAGDLTAEEAYELLKISSQKFADAIANGFSIYLNQNQFNALVLLKYNIGYLSNIPGFMDYIENGVYDREEMTSMINGYYDSIIKGNPEKAIYRNGWYNRTEAMLDVFFDGNYGYMPIDAVNGEVNK